jgi:RNA polymerase sigma-70 factor (sigma-E family)
MSGGRRDEAFCAFVATHRDRLVRAAILVCGDPARAEDLVQTALARLYVAWPRLDREGRVEAYARRIIINAQIDETRRPWRRERSGLDGVDVAATPAGAWDDRDELWRAIRSLPRRQRQVVVLRHYWGLSVEETADDLRVSTGTVKSQTSAALAKLRTALAGDAQATRR